MPFRIGILGASMFLFLRVVALIAAMMLNCGVASADGVVTDVMPGCRGFIKDGAYLSAIRVGTFMPTVILK